MAVEYVAAQLRSPSLTQSNKSSANNSRARAISWFAPRPRTMGILSKFRPEAVTRFNANADYAGLLLKAAQSSQAKTS